MTKHPVTMPASLADREALNGSRWFCSLPAGMQDYLLTTAEPMELQNGALLFARGDAFDGIYAVTRGALRITGSNEEGKEALLVLAEAPGWLGEISLIDGLPRTHDALAEGPTRLLRISPAALQAMLEAHPDWWQWFALLVAGKMRFAFLGLEDAALMPAARRVVRRLILMAEGYGDRTDNPRQVLPLAQEQLAAMLALSRQTINPILKQLEGRGLIRLTYRELEILDLERLRQEDSPAAH